MHLWRFPFDLLALGVLCLGIATLWLPVAGPGSALPAYPRQWLYLLILASLSLPLTFCVVWFAEDHLHDFGSSFRYPRWLVVLPLFLAAGAVATVCRLVQATSPSGFRWRLGVLCYWFLFGLANILNQCQPGWCGEFGVPFVFLRYSDAVMTFNGEVVPPPFSLLALLGDTLVFWLGTLLLIALQRRVGQTPSHIAA